MESANIHHLELIILFMMVLVVALAAMARRFKTPYPIVLVIGGLAVSLLPGVPRVSLNPDVIFLVLLPPLLFGAAFHTSWRSFCRSLNKSSMMAFGLVGFSVIGVAFITGHLLPGFDHRVGSVLGALVASTDAIAATAIARRMHLPQRITDVLEGESLLNDATALLALEFSVAMLVADSTPTFGSGLARLVALVAGGVAVGLLAGWIIRWCQTRLTDAPLEITFTLLAPYVAYLAAEGLHVSGVLATVVCGLFLGEKQSQALSPRARVEAAAVWNTLDFILNGIVFTLIGLQLPYVLEGIKYMSAGELWLDVSILVGLLIALRLLWVYAASWIAFGIRKLMRQPAAPPQANETFVLGWTGMRGVIALAAAMSLPQTLDSGDPFPQRDLLIFLTFCVILITLVAQGLSLPFVIRKVGLATPASEPQSL
ncbi:MAG TPA: Na+/H+ antiporter [Terracidiphilus sp.]|jgi:CPA1 family monovalent cation:H+ antiporter